MYDAMAVLPRWVVAVACVAVLVTGGLYSFAQHRRRVEAEAALVQAQTARAEALRAQAEARAAQERVDQLSRSPRELDARTAAAIEALASAQTEAERRAARIELDHAIQQKREIEQRMRTERPPIRRTGAIRISKECLDNPLARGCD